MEKIISQKDTDSDEGGRTAVPEGASASWKNINAAADSNKAETRLAYGLFLNNRQHLYLRSEEAELNLLGYIN